MYQASSLTQKLSSLIPTEVSESLSSSQVLTELDELSSEKEMSFAQIIGQLDTIPSEVVTPQVGAPPSSFNNQLGDAEKSLENSDTEVPTNVTDLSLDSEIDPSVAISSINRSSRNRLDSVNQQLLKTSKLQTDSSELPLVHGESSEHSPSPKSTALISGHFVSDDLEQDEVATLQIHPAQNKSKKDTPDSENSILGTPVKDDFAQMSTTFNRAVIKSETPNDQSNSKSKEIDIPNLVERGDKHANTLNNALSHKSHTLQTQEKALVSLGNELPQNATRSNEDLEPREKLLTSNLNSNDLISGSSNKSKEIEKTDISKSHLAQRVTQPEVLKPNTKENLVDQIESENPHLPKFMETSKNPVSAPLSKVQSKPIENASLGLQDPSTPEDSKTLKNEASAPQSSTNLNDKNVSALNGKFETETESQPDGQLKSGKDPKISTDKGSQDSDQPHQAMESQKSAKLTAPVGNPELEKVEKSAAFQGDLASYVTKTPKNAQKETDLNLGTTTAPKSDMVFDKAENTSDTEPKRDGAPSRSFAQSRVPISQPNLLENVLTSSNSPQEVTENQEVKTDLATLPVSKEAPSSVAPISQTKVNPQESVQEKVERINESLLKEVARLRPLTTGALQLSVNTGGAKDLVLHLSQKGEWVEVQLMSDGDDSSLIMKNLGHMNDVLAKHQIKIHSQQESRFDDFSQSHDLQKDNKNKSSSEESQREGNPNSDTEFGEKPHNLSNTRFEHSHEDVLHESGQLNLLA